MSTPGTAWQAKQEREERSYRSGFQTLQCMPNTAIVSLCTVYPPCDRGTDTYSPAKLKGTQWSSDLKKNLVIWTQLFSILCNYFNFQHQLFLGVIR